MANALAIAGVTAVLRNLLNDGLINASMDSLGQFEVSSLPLDEIRTPDGGAPVNRLNVFMWHATRNPGWANERLPARAADGTRIDSPYLALDLHFILTATGAEQLNAEILLGYGMQLMHETPVLTRDAIRAALGGLTPPVEPSLLPPAMQTLLGATLADQFEQIRITPAALDSDSPGQIETLSNIWSAFSTALRASALYQASCVLIESRTPVRSALPVLTLGGRTAPIRRPRIDRVRPLPDGPGTTPLDTAPLQPGDAVALEGTALAAPSMRVLLGDRVLAPVGDIANTRLDVVLPPDLRAGLARIAVEHLFTPEGSATERVWEMSNAAPLVVLPVLDSHAVAGAVATGRFSGTVSATLGHEVGPDQVAALLFNPLPGNPEPAFSVRCAPLTVAGTEVVAEIADVPAADYLIRVEIDGAASPLTMGPAGFDGPVAELGA